MGVRRVRLWQRPLRRVLLPPMVRVPLPLQALRSVLWEAAVRVPVQWALRTGRLRRPVLLTRR